MGRFSSFFSKKAPQYTLCIAAVFKNEAAYLREWIEFHRLVGVQHFFLYDNESSDAPLKLLAPYIEQGLVTYAFWPLEPSEKLWIPAQKRAYNHCLSQFGARTKWIAFIDIDEFLIPMQHPDLLEFLAFVERDPLVGGIQVHWQLYGTSGLFALPEGGLLTEWLTKKAPSDYRAAVGLDNRKIKSIVRPAAVKSYDIHFAEYKWGWKTFPASNPHNPLPVDQIRLNHYWSRTEEFFYEVKLDRRLKFSPLKRELLIEKLKDLSQVEDPIMMRFVPYLKNKINQKS